MEHDLYYSAELDVSHSICVFVAMTLFSALTNKNAY
jgi:hypothetical protein